MKRCLIFSLPNFRQMTFSGRLTTVCAMAEGRFQGAAASLSKNVPLRGWALSLGLLAWSVAALLPSVHRGTSLSTAALALLPVGPVLLVSGLWLCGLRSRLAPYALLALFPTSLALSASRLEHDTALATFSPWVLSFALLALSSYLAAASALCARPETMRSVEHRPLGEIPAVDLETRKQRLGRAALVGVALGAMGLVAWASWATPAHFREMWGRAAPEGATLTALCAGIVGALSLSLVGPGLRAERAPPIRREQRMRRVSWLLLVALSGVVVYAALRAR
jgi:hypothetical protein